MPSLHHACVLAPLLALLWQAEGDEFTIRVSFEERGSVEFVRNGVSQYRHVGLDTRREQYLAVCLYHKGTKVTVLP
jgi:hypothetical protein